MMQGGGPVSASLTSSASSAARSPPSPWRRCYFFPSSSLCWPEPLLASPFSPRRWHPPAVSTQLRSRSGEPRVWEGGAWETRGRGSVKRGGLWPWAHPVDFSSPLSRPLWSRVKCFSYPGLQRGQFADSTTYQTVVKHHVPDHALMELMV